MKLLIPTDAPFTLAPAPDGVEVVTYDPNGLIADEHLDADAAVVWGFVADHLRQLAQDMPKLRWVQAMAAGPDALLAAGIPDHVAISVGRGFHDKTVTELATALTLAATTQLPAYLEAQKEHDWQGPGWRPLHVPERLATIIDAEVLIWGFGSIGQNLAPVLSALGAHVRGIASSAGERAGYEVFTADELPRLLPETDVLIMILPSDASTHHALDADRLAQLKDTAWVVNVGRGSTIDEDALVTALHAGTLGGAALDVTATEPLPPDSALWDAPRTILTPHVAGGRPVGVEGALRRNLAHLQAGEPLELLAKEPAARPA